MRFGPFTWLHSLAAQLLLTYVAALLITTCVILGLLSVRSQQDARVTAGAQLHKFAGLVSHRAQFPPAGVPLTGVPLDSEWSWLLRDFASDVKYRILDASGHLLVSSDNGSAASSFPGLTFSATPVTNALVADGNTLFIRTERIVRGANTYYIQVAISQRFSAFVRAITAYFRVSDTLILAILSVVLVSIAVYFTLRRVLRPLTDASAAAAQIDARNLSRRLSIHRVPSEFLPTITAFNLTLDRLEKGYIVQRAFLADAAHELKTPLALLRAQIDVGGTADRHTLLEDVDHMARQVNQLLHLAEASETQNYSFEWVDLSDVMDDVTDYLRRLAQRYQVDIEISGPPDGARTRADRGASFMLFKNLLENAIQHSPPGGVVLLEVCADQINVRDEGQGIPLEAIPNLFKRFWRGPARRDDGAGLGLSICQEIAAAHNWKISAQNCQRGAQFTVLFSAPTD